VISRQGGVRKCPWRNRRSAPPIRLKELSKSAILGVPADGPPCYKNAAVKKPRADYGSVRLHRSKCLNLPTETELSETYSLYNNLGYFNGRSLNVAFLLLLLKSQRYKNVDSSKKLRTFQRWYRF